MIYAGRMVWTRSWKLRRGSHGWYVMGSCLISDVWWIMQTGLYQRDCVDWNAYAGFSYLHN